MRKGTKVLAIIMAVVLMMSVFTACGGGTSEKEFSKNGLTITLPVNAKEMDSSYGYSVAYQIGSSIVVAAIKEDVSSLLSVGLEENATVKDYAQLVAEVNGYSADSVTTIAGTNIPVIEYTANVSGVDYKYIGSCYKAEDCFWFINFGTTASNFDSVKGDFEKWAASVEV